MLRFCIIVLFLINFQTSFSYPDYSMQIAGPKLLNDSTISFQVYINCTDSSLKLTSYQCALCFNNDIPIYGFSYLNGSSEFKNLTPSVGIGLNYSDGFAKITFASLPGSEIITTNKIRVGDFRIKTKINNNKSIPLIKWCFSNKVNTILTSSNFQDITDSERFSTAGLEQIKVLKVTASTTADTNANASKTIDGKGANDGDDYSRWAAQPMPAYLIFDLGGEKKINETKFSFYKWDGGRIYHYSISTSVDSSYWEDIVVNDSSSPEEWTVNSINKNARYVKLTFLSNNQNLWAGLWEAQILGSVEITGINHEIEVGKNKAPIEYVLNQNYPNPFNPATKINFVLAEPGRVNLDVYNILGEKVSTLVDQEMAAGSHEVNFNASNLASGVYIYMLNVQNKFVDTRKMILMK